MSSETQLILHENNNNVNIWWFPREFSQSAYGSRNTGSNACTLIALLMAQKCYQYDIKICIHKENSFNPVLVGTLAESILEGNEIHEEMLRKGELHHENLTVPEAIKIAGPKTKFVSEWKSLVYQMDLGESLYEKLHETVAEWYQNPPPCRGSDLYVILITANRSVLMAFENNLDMVTLIDSHQHPPYGAVIAQVSTAELQNLCLWYNTILCKFYRASPDCYELSYLYFKKQESGKIAYGLKITDNDKGNGIL